MSHPRHQTDRSRAVFLTATRPASRRPAVRSAGLEDSIFRVILPSSCLAEALEAESPGDWGARVLEEGDLLSPLAA